MSRISKLMRESNVDKQKYAKFKHSLEAQYVQMVVNNTVQNTFYTDEAELLRETEVMHKMMLERDTELMAKTLVYAREEANVIMQPVIGLAYLSTHRKKKWFRKAFRRIIKTPKDLCDFMDAVSSVREGKGLGRVIKEEVSNWLNNLSEYHCIKYGSTSSSEEWSLPDIVRAVHPIPKDSKKDMMFRHLTSKVKGSEELTETELNSLPQINSHEKLKRAEDKQEIISLINEGRLPVEVVTSEATMDKEVWGTVLHQMPYFALLRHLSTLERNGVIEEHLGYIIDKLTNTENVQKSRVMPFRIYQAYERVEHPHIKAALAQALEESLDNIPEIKGSTAIFLDVSYSMDKKFLKIGAVLAGALMHQSEEHDFKMFSEVLRDIRIEEDESIPEIVDKVLKSERGGTNIGSCFNHLLGTAKDKEVRQSKEEGVGEYAPEFRNSEINHGPKRFDNVVIITDEQQNSGDMLHETHKEYKRRFPDCNTFIINVTPYDSHVEPEKDMNYVRGWSDNVVRHISSISTGQQTQIEEVKRMKI